MGQYDSYKENLVKSCEDIKKNILTLKRGIASENQKECKYYKKLIRRGIIFVAVKINGEPFFAPSMFVGYLENNMEKHDGSDHTHGTFTTNKIISLLHKKPETNASLEAEFQNFCKQNHIEPHNRERKYWNVSNLFGEP